MRWRPAGRRCGCNDALAVLLVRVPAVVCSQDLPTKSCFYWPLAYLNAPQWRIKPWPDGGACFLLLSLRPCDASLYMLLGLLAKRPLANLEQRHSSSLLKALPSSSFFFLQINFNVQLPNHQLIQIFLHLPPFTKQDLKDFMRQAGEVTYADAHKRERNMGIVDFNSHSDMKNAIEKLDGFELHGRRIRLVEDKTRTGRRGR